MITGLHAIIYSRDAEADRAFVRDVLGFAAVDAGEDYLIFQAPPAELAFHPDGQGSKHELYLMCDDVKAEVKRLAGKDVTCSPISDEGWGLLSSISLPGGGALGLYEPRHPTALGQKH